MCSDITTILPPVEYSKRISLDRNNKSVITNPMVEVNRRTHDPELQLKHPIWNLPGAENTVTRD